MAELNKESEIKTSVLPERVTHERIIEAPETRLVLDKRMIGKVKATDTTPNVLNVEYWKAQNTGAVTVTDFLKGQEGQHLYILGDGFTTIQNGAKIETQSGADTLLTNDKMYHFILMNGKWRQI